MWVLVALGSHPGAAYAAATTETSPLVEVVAFAGPTPTVDDAPPPTVSDFYPEEENLSDCVGLVEKPGCGSDARGGWRQTLVFAIVVAGIGIIGWRVVAGARRDRPTR